MTYLTSTNGNTTKSSASQAEVVVSLQRISIEPLLKYTKFRVTSVVNDFSPGTFLLQNENWAILLFYLMSRMSELSSERVIFPAAGLWQFAGVGSLHRRHSTSRRPILHYYPRIYYFDSFQFYFFNEVQISYWMVRKLQCKINLKSRSSLDHHFRSQRLEVWTKNCNTSILCGNDSVYGLPIQSEDWRVSTTELAGTLDGLVAMRSSERADWARISSIDLDPRSVVPTSAPREENA